MSLRLRDLDKEAQEQKLREKVKFCLSCWQPYVPPVKHLCKKSPPQITKCRACSAEGPKYKLFPWLQEKVDKDIDVLLKRLGSLKDGVKKKSPTLRDISLRCYTCKQAIDINSWIGIKLQCTECGIRCDECEGYIKKCEYCDTIVLRDSFDYHQQNECKGNSWLRWGWDKVPEMPKYTCKVGNCNEQFKTERGLSFHMLEEHFVDQRELGRWWLLWQDQPKVIECHLCTKTFINFKDRERHIRISHKKYIGRHHYNFKCDLCGNEVSYKVFYDHPKLCRNTVLSRTHYIRRNY